MEGIKIKIKKLKNSKLQYKIKYKTSKIHFSKIQFHYKPTCEVGSV
jgi:hypothetical protein